MVVTVYTSPSQHLHISLHSSPLSLSHSLTPLLKSHWIIAPTPSYLSFNPYHPIHTSFLSFTLTITPSDPHPHSSPLTPPYPTSSSPSHPTHSPHPSHTYIRQAPKTEVVEETLMILLCLCLIQVFCNALEMGQCHLQTKGVWMSLWGILEKVLCEVRSAVSNYVLSVLLYNSYPQYVKKKTKSVGEEVASNTSTTGQPTPVMVCLQGHIWCQCVSINGNQISGSK